MPFVVYRALKGLRPNDISELQPSQGAPELSGHPSAEERQAAKALQCKLVCNGLVFNLLLRLPPSITNLLFTEFHQFYLFSLLTFIHHFFAHSFIILTIVY